MTFLAFFRPLALARQALPAIEYKADMADLIRPEVAA